MTGIFEETFVRAFSLDKKWPSFGLIAVGPVVVLSKFCLIQNLTEWKARGMLSAECVESNMNSTHYDGGPDGY